MNPLPPPHRAPPGKHCRSTLGRLTSSPIYTNMRSAAVSHSGCEYEHFKPHFLDSCFLCHKHLSQNSDIFMYRGNTPFCSQECRQEQIEMDESTEKIWKISSSKNSNSESTKKSHTKKTVPTSTVAVA